MPLATVDDEAAMPSIVRILSFLLPAAPARVLAPRPWRSRVTPSSSLATFT